VQAAIRSAAVHALRQSGRQSLAVAPLTAMTAVALLPGDKSGLPVLLYFAKVLIIIEKQRFIIK